MYCPPENLHHLLVSWTRPLEILIVAHAIHELTQLPEASFKWTKVRGDDTEDFVLEPHFRGEDGELVFGNRGVTLVWEEPLGNEGTLR